MAAAKSPSVRLDPFVAAVRKEPGDSGPLLFLSGFVGRSPAKGRLRIYPDASLSHWLEAAEADVVHSAPIANSPLGGSHLWLRGSAALTAGPAASAQAGDSWFTHHFCAAPPAAAILAPTNGTTQCVCTAEPTICGATGALIC
jgi:hypothetical protein